MCCVQVGVKERICFFKLFDWLVSTRCHSSIAFVRHQTGSAVESINETLLAPYCCRCCLNRPKLHSLDTLVGRISYSATLNVLKMSDGSTILILLFILKLILVPAALPLSSRTSLLDFAPNLLAILVHFNRFLRFGRHHFLLELFLSCFIYDIPRVEFQRPFWAIICLIL